MRAVIAALILILCGASGAQALARGEEPSMECPSGAPSPDGSSIFPSKTQNSCILTDYQGNKWQYRTDDYLYENGRRNLLDTLETQIDSGGHEYTQFGCKGSTLTFWSSPARGSQVISPTKPLANSFYLIRGGSTVATYPGLYSLLQGGKTQNGDTIEIKSPPAGLAMYRTAGAIGQFSGQANLTLNFDAKAAIGCVQVFGSSILFGEANNLTINGGEIAYAHDPDNGSYRGVNTANACGWTLNGTYIHDNDMGILANNCAVRTTFRLINVKLAHNGELPNRGGASATHNLYAGWVGKAANTSALVIHGGYSICSADGQGLAGFPYKSRQNSTTITGTMISTEAEGFGWTNCFNSADIDLSCGGVARIGEAGTGNGNTILLGPSVQNTSGGIIRWAAETNSTHDCPGVDSVFTASISGRTMTVTAVRSGALKVGDAIAGKGIPSSTMIAAFATGSGGMGTYTVSQSLSLSSEDFVVPGWTKNTLSVANNVIINDNAHDFMAVSNLWKPGSSVTVTNNVVVCNGRQPCNFGHMFPGMTDGGGNVFYASRAAARAALGWSGKDQFGNPCCAPPWMPPHR